MSTLVAEVRAQSLVVTEESLIVDLSDGRSISVPLAWYPRLVHGSPEERNSWRLIGRGEGIHWPELDEDISVEGADCGAALGRESAIIRELAARAALKRRDRGATWRTGQSR